MQLAVSLPTSDLDRLRGVLENNVRKWVAAGDLLLNLGVKVVLDVLGLPEAAEHAEQIAQGAVGEDSVLADFQFLFGNQLPAMRLGGFFQKALEGGFQGAFVGDLVVAEAFQRLAVLADRLVGRLNQSGIAHG